MKTLLLRNQSLKFIFISVMFLIASCSSKTASPVPTQEPTSAEKLTPTSISSYPAFTPEPTFTENLAPTNISSYPAFTPEPTFAENLTPTSNQAYPAPLNTQPAYNDAYPVPSGQVRITPYPTGQVPIAPTDAPQPKNGKASISGTVFSFTISLVVPKTFFYLTPGWGSEKKDPPPAFVGPNAKNGDISAYTDDTGQFFLDNIPPGNYYLVVSAPYNWSEAENSPTDNKPRLITLAANQKYPLGVIYVSWP